MALYLDHFSLKEPPFRITPHADFFFDGADRGATLEGLMYAILHDEGIVKVSGEIGSGKTTLCRVLIDRLPEEVETVFLANPSYSRTEILHAIAEELGRPAAAAADERAASAVRDLQARLIELYAAGRRVVVLIDEAHAMPEDTLEQVRLLSNLETSRHKLLQIALFGQPELDEALAKPSLRQLKDRITHSFRTRPLLEDEVGKYIAFRMRAAGYRGPDVFTKPAVTAIARGSSGLTRRVNVLCDKALLAAFAANRHAVTPREVRAALADSDFATIGGKLRPGRALTAAGLLGLGALAGAGILYALNQAERAPAPAAAPKRIVAPAPAPKAAAPASAAPAEEKSAPVPAPPPTPPAEKPAPPPLLSAEQLRRLEGYGAAGNALLRERLASTREKLLSAPDGSYGIELFATENSDPARTERFLLRARDLVPLSEMYVVPVGGKPRYQLHMIYGAFATRDEAAQAAKRLPPKYQNAFRFELRSFAEIRASI